ncbi:hypothetical protein [Streptomyces sp. NPDC127098]|uniref:hypothetical protein n=1 Tax=Streptomyces sp. NPDC127098 TaxID=3347137 RepID=UPI00364CE570
MTYEVDWEPEAVAQAERFAKSDPQGIRQVFAAVDHLRTTRGPRARSAATIYCASTSGSTG